MATRDMYNSIKELIAIYPRAVGTTGAANGVTSPIIDMQNYEKITFVYSAGGSASVADTVTPVVLECATTGGTFTSVADTDLLGTEDALTLATAAGQVNKIGYIGSKRYLKFKLYGTGTATAIVAAHAVAGPHLVPHNS